MSAPTSDTALPSFTTASENPAAVERWRAKFANRQVTCFHCTHILPTSDRWCALFKGVALGSSTAPTCPRFTFDDDAFHRKINAAARP